jgi:hypothetical protein
MHVILRPLGMHVILRPLGMHVILRPAWSACDFAAAFRSKLILLSAKIDNDPFFGNAPGIVSVAA